MDDQSKLEQVARDNWNANRGVDPDVMRDLGYDTPDTLPDTIERVVGKQTASAAGAQLELVSESHTPRPDARREAKLRERPPASTAKAKADRDKGESLKHRTPPEWTPLLTNIPGESGSVDKG